MSIKLFNVKIVITFWFSLAISTMLFTDKTGLIIPTILAVFIHESAHILAMKIKKCTPKEIILMPGAVSIVNNNFCEIKTDNFILLSGPLANILFFAVFYLLYWFSKAEIFAVYGVVQLIIGCLNFMPAKGLDGGSLIYNFALKISTVSFANLLLNITTLTTIFILTFLGVSFLISDGNLSLIILAIYILILYVVKR